VFRVPTVPKLRVRVNTVLAQLSVAVAVMLGGAALIGLWVVGVVLMVGGLLLAADAVLRDSTDTSLRRPVSHEDVLERWRRAR
jgi:hypothetical protein